MINTNKPAIEYNTREWEIVEAWLREELQDTYKSLASLTTSDEKTHQLRGRASLITTMLGWKEDRAAPLNLGRTLT